MSGNNRHAADKFIFSEGGGFIPRQPGSNDFSAVMHGEDGKNKTHRSKQQVAERCLPQRDPAMLKEDAEESKEASE
jgi:hypothetical protein